MRLTASKNAKLGLFVYDYEGIGPLRVQLNQILII